MNSIALQQFFITERDRCNQLVASVRHQHPFLEIKPFSAFLRDSLDSLMLQLETRGDCDMHRFALAAFEHGLQLAIGRWLGEDGKGRCLRQVWSALYPLMPHYLIDDPENRLAHIQNVIHNLYLIDSGAPLRWIDKMSAIITDCRQHDLVEKAGVVCAWLSGMAHFRTSALQVLAELPENVHRTLFHLQPEHDHRQHCRDLSRYHWYPTGKQKVLVCQQLRVGSSEYFEGNFVEPPLLASRDGQLLVKSADKYFGLFADQFGAVLIPKDRDHLSDVDFHASEFHFKSIPEYHRAIHSCNALLDIRDFRSACQLDDTLALTSGDTFAIILLSLRLSR